MDYQVVLVILQPHSMEAQIAELHEQLQQPVYVALDLFRLSRFWRPIEHPCNPFIQGLIIGGSNLRIVDRIGTRYYDTIWTRQRHYFRNVLAELAKQPQPSPFANHRNTD